MKLTTRSLLTLTLSLGLTLALFAAINLAQPGSPTLDPPRNSHSAPPTTTVSITYEGPINATTVNSRTFAVHAMQSGLLTGTHGVTGATLTVTPTRPFFQGELVYAIAATHTLNVSGTVLLAPIQWQFRAGQVAARCVGGFTDVGAGLAGVHHSSAAWGDYDADGDLDVLLTGYSDAGPIARIYRNDPAASDRTSASGRSFTDIDAGLPGFYWGSAAWGDYDNDGDLDILLTGYSDLERRTTRLYRNDPSTSSGRSPAAGSGRSFTDIDAGLKGTRWGMAIWGDYDNDGDLDILLTGYGGGSKDVTLVYRNDGSGTFTDIDAGLANVEASAVAWGDYDDDGDLDVLLTGFVITDSLRVSRLYRNDGPAASPGSGWSFSDAGAELPDVAYGALAWGDYDSDGHLDILFTGEDSGGALLTRIYHNDGPSAGWSFSDAGAGLVDVAYGALAWGDYDDDGDLDVLLTGYNLVARVYRNDDCASDLELVKTAITPLAASDGSAQIPSAASGDAITYTLSFSNVGTLTATQVIITDAVPVGQVANLSYTASSGVTRLGTGLVPPYVWQVAELAPGASGAITITGLLNADLPVLSKAPEGYIITNTASITSTAPDANPANNTSSATIAVSASSGGRVYLPLVVRTSPRYLASGGYAVRVTQSEIDDAITDGIVWLAANQESDGSWTAHTAATCFALSALQQYAYDLGFDTWDDAGFPYRDNVIHGWQYVFTPTRAVKVSPLSVQPAGDPDSNGNGYGLSFQYDSQHHVYAGGVCMAALEASGTPHRENDGGLDYDGDGNPDTFLELAQEAVDWMALAQLDGGEGRGNWYYTVEDNGSGNPDQSNGGFAVLGLAAAERLGAIVPPFVRVELDHAIDYIQCSTPGADYGGAGYSSPCSYVNEYKTGLLILQMGFYGDNPSVGRFQDALDYMDRHWQDGNNNPGWGYDSNPSGYLSMLPLLKGLRYNGIGLLDTDGDGSRDDDWYMQEPPASPAQDLSSVLVAQQELDGSWPYCDWGDVTLCTSWALLTLQKAALTPPDQPDAWIQAELGGFVGDDVYNTDAAAQTASANTGVGQAAAYHVRIENDGSLTNTYTVTGAAGAGAWSVVYQDAGSADVSAQITGAGWSTGDLAPGEAVSVTVRVTPDTRPKDGPAYSVLISVVSSGAPSRVDAVRADTTINAYYYVDLALKLASENAVVAPGGAVSHTLTFSNSGTLSATQVVITSALPLQAFDTLTYSVGGGAIAGTALVPPYVWRVSVLAPGAGGAITISGVLKADLPVLSMVKVAGGYVITHTASITSAAPDANPADNASSVTISVSAPPGMRIYLPLLMRASAADARYSESTSRYYKFYIGNRWLLK